MRIKSDIEDQAGYLLIREVISGGAIALDAKGEMRPISEDFILTHWDGEMSWVYPYEHKRVKLSEGMGGQSVLRIQHMLQQMGYSLEARGFYDSTTSDEVMRFQRDFGLDTSGIMDAGTKAVLYQVSG